MMRLTIRHAGRRHRIDVTITAADAEAEAWFEAHRDEAGVRLLLRGSPDYALSAALSPADPAVAALRARVGHSVHLSREGVGSLRRRLDQVAIGVVLPSRPLELAPGLWLHHGALSTGPQLDEEPRAALVAAARWVSARRTVSFERLFPPDPFHPERPERLDRVDPAEGEALRAWLAAQLHGDAPTRSAAATLLSHLVATRGRDRAFAAVGRAAAADLLGLARREAVAALRAHVIGLLQLRGPALDADHAAEARELLQTLSRVAPPYDQLGDRWDFAMVSAWDFHEGEVEVLQSQHAFVEVEARGAPPTAGHGVYRCFEAPFTGPRGQPVRIWARAGHPTDETREMGEAFFCGLLINRHAQLGSFDLRAAALATPQQGYKLMLNSQCAGLTTRFAIARCYPDADLYTSWDSTWFRTDASGKLSASEGLDCFVAVLRGMAAGEDHAGLSRRIRRAQWHHEAGSAPDFVQFIGPAFPAVVARYADVNHDGKADLYDGFLDLDLRAIAEDLAASASPRDPGVPASAISGEAATGLGWAVGSMNRVAQYSDLWEGLPERSELFYPFVAAGFYDAGAELDAPVPTGDPPGQLPALCRYSREAGLRAELSMHAWLAHSGKELKRLLVAAEALHRAFDAGLLRLPAGLDSVAHRRGMLLLTLAGLLEFPADQNRIDALWSTALGMLRLPELSRSLVRACINDADHDASNYYGSRRGLPELLAKIEAADAVAAARLRDPDPRIGRAGPLQGGSG